jgi:hypothetical protein
VAVAALLGTALLTLHAQKIIPEPAPDPQIPGFRFPETEATITSWVTALSKGDAVSAVDAAEKIQRHGWGIWTSLTKETGQLYEGQFLRVFETWLTPDDLHGAAAPRSLDLLTPSPRGRAPLQDVVERPSAPPKRRINGRRSLRSDSAEDEPVPEALPAADPDMADRLAGFVKFDPSAATHILRQDLLNAETLKALLLGGAQGIPPFPSSSLVVKTHFQVMRSAALVDGRYFALKVWEGPPPTPQAIPPTQWPAVVWIDLLNGGQGRGRVDAVGAQDGNSRTEATTYPLSGLMHYRMSAADAAALNEDQPGTQAQAGDIALLVAMHVSGREIARWTWQSFWWTPNPDDPPAPSSRAIASQRPDQLRGAARNYAMAQTYTMLIPDPPYVGGGNVGAAVYAYNPWFEARFSPKDLPDSLAGSDPNGQPATNNHGVQSNCMSCHAQASYNPRGLATAPRFTGARYVDLSDPQFVGTLQVDFLWSIARHAR